MEINTLYTPAPWAVKHSETKPAFNVIGTVLGGRYKIARCPYIAALNREREEAQSNARLIAAAPELLEALLQITGQFGTQRNADNYSRFAIEKAEAAIAKATGKEVPCK
ncbi:MAG: hypothetical protein V4615_05055 [Bacteroidota bacterium]